MLLGIELSYRDVFSVIPRVGGILGKTIYITIHWLNFELTIKHLSNDYNAKRMYFGTPSITINQYIKSGYRFIFEICIFDYTYRKGLFRLKDRDVEPTDNTYGFVDTSWFEQFRKNDNGDLTANLMEELQNMIKTLKDKLEDNERKN